MYICIQHTLQIREKYVDIYRYGSYNKPIKSNGASEEAPSFFFHV